MARQGGREEPQARPLRRGRVSAAPEIRTAVAADAPAVSAVIVEALRISNAADYPAAVIDRVAAGFVPGRVAAMIEARRTLVALDGGAVVGTGALEGRAVRSVFVRPACQGRGVGRALMAEILRLARADGAAELLLRSSLTARGFYARLGFEPVREETGDGERTVIMRLALGAPLPPTAAV